jgi:hypothetical protein
MSVTRPDRSIRMNAAGTGTGLAVWALAAKGKLTSIPPPAASETARNCLRERPIAEVVVEVVLISPPRL